MPKTYTQLFVHLIFATKHRSAAIRPEVRDDLYRYISAILDRESSVALAIGGMPDHIHVLVSYRPIHAIAFLTKQVKGASSRWLNKSGELGEIFAWQEGYGAFSVSSSQLNRVRSYILNQAAHHRSRSFAQEWDDLLKRHAALEHSLSPEHQPQ